MIISINTPFGNSNKMQLMVLNLVWISSKMITKDGSAICEEKEKEIPLFGVKVESPHWNFHYRCAI